MTPREFVAWSGLVLLALIPLVLAIRAWRRTRYTAVQYGLFLAAYGLVRLLWRAKLPNHPPTPPGQGAVLIANHHSSVDPFFVQMTLAEPSHWMVAREYCESRLFGWFLRQCEVIPTGRGGVDTAAIKSAIRLAQAGQLVGMFPEGRINESPDFMLPVRPGAILVALRARVPVIPCYIEGAPTGPKVWSPLVRLARTTVTYGPPIDLSAYYEREQEEGLRGELICRCVEQLALLAGRPDFRPRLAGRRWLTASRTDATDDGNDSPTNPADRSGDDEPADHNDRAGGSDGAHGSAPPVAPA